MTDYGTDGYREPRAHNVYTCEKCKRTIPWGAKYINFASYFIPGRWGGRMCLHCDEPAHISGMVSPTYVLSRMRDQTKVAKELYPAVDLLEIESDEIGLITWLPKQKSRLQDLLKSQTPAYRKAAAYEVRFAFKIVALVLLRCVGNPKKMKRFGELLAEMYKLAHEK